MLALDEYITFLDGKITKRLSLAVALIDEYTAMRPIGSIWVFIKDQNFKAIKNRSGYYLFLDLPKGKYRIRVESEYYFDEETNKIDLPVANPQNPQEITLSPKPSYPFPPGVTLIRGMVQDLAENPVSDTKVEVIGKPVSSRTNVKGEFVLYFKLLTEVDIHEEGSKRYIKGNGGKIIHLKATHDSKTGTADLIEGVEEGKMTPLESPIVLS